MKIPGNWSAALIGILATGLLAVPDRAHAQDRGVTLDVIGGYRGYGYESEWVDDREALFEQSFQAALDSYFIDRAVSTYHLGFALDHRTAIDNNGDARDAMGYRYDARLSLWPRGDVPITLWANRQIFDAYQSTVAGVRSTSTSYGYSAAVDTGEYTPRIQSSGYLQDLEMVQGDQVELRRNYDIRNSLMHVRNRLVVRGHLDRRRQVYFTDDRARDQTTGEVYADYRITPTTSVNGRARSTSYQAIQNGEVVDLDMQFSDARFRWRPTEKVLGTTYYRSRRSAYDGTYAGENAAGTSWSWRASDLLNTNLVAGVDDAWLETPEEYSRFYGQHVNTSAQISAGGRGGSVRLQSQGGLAGIQEVGGGSGVQAGTGVDAQANKVIASHLVRVGVGGGMERQWDSSPRDLDYMAYHWSTTLGTRQFAGISLGLHTSERVVRQLSADEGSSDRFQTTGTARARFSPRVYGSYGLNVYRDVLDEEYINGLAHTLQIDLTPMNHFLITGAYHYSVYDQADLEALWTHRAEATAIWKMRVVNIQARYIRTLSGGRVPDVRSDYVWVELSRRFGVGF